MRSPFLLACASLALAAAVACATSADDAPLSPPNDPEPTPLPDGGIADGGLTRDASDPIVSSCSGAGWCLTSLPDGDLTLKDIWPFESRAFAIAESQTLGVKVLEWDEAGTSWKYIDDNSQNAYGFGKYAGKIWAPNENEIYYGVEPAFIHHGKRAAPASPWSWERSQLADNSRDTDPARDHGLARYTNRHGQPVEYPAIGVWGTSADDVYAWYANTIFHWKSDDGGAPAWVAEYVADDTENLAETFFVFGASGSSRDDIWFAGGRARHVPEGTFACPIVIHKTADGYKRIVDHVINGRFPFYLGYCQPKAGALSFPGVLVGWLTNVESAGPGRAVGIMAEAAFAYVASEDGGLARLNEVRVRTPRPDDEVPTLLSSVWVHGTEAWLSGWGLVLRTDNDPARWSTGLGLFTPDDAEHGAPDAATYSVSATALNGVPLDRPLYQVRGTSNTNLWAIGPRYALHKTTP